MSLGMAWALDWLFSSTSSGAPAWGFTAWMPVIWTPWGSWVVSSRYPSAESSHWLPPPSTVAAAVRSTTSRFTRSGRTRWSTTRST